MSAITDSPSRRRRDSWVANPPAKTSVGQTKSVCIIGAGHVGAPHAIMMAKKCPSVKFTVVDDDERRVAAFKSSSLLPFYEPGMAETLDDDGNGRIDFVEFARNIGGLVERVHGTRALKASA